MYDAMTHSSVDNAPLVPFRVFLLGRLHEGLAPLAERVRGTAPQEVVETEPGGWIRQTSYSAFLFVNRAEKNKARQNTRQRSNMICRGR